MILVGDSRRGQPQRAAVGDSHLAIPQLDTNKSHDDFCCWWRAVEGVGTSVWTLGPV